MRVVVSGGQRYRGVSVSFFFPFFLFIFIFLSYFSVRAFLLALQLSVLLVFCLVVVYIFFIFIWSSSIVCRYFYNAFRLFVYGACGSSFWLTPKHMPDLLMFATRGPEEGPSEPITLPPPSTRPPIIGGGEGTEEVIAMNEVVEGGGGGGGGGGEDSMVSKGWRYCFACCVKFEFVHWSSAEGVGVTYERSSVRHLLPSESRRVIVNADQWTRAAFWTYVVLACWLSVADGYWCVVFNFFFLLCSVSLTLCFSVSSAFLVLLFFPLLCLLLFLFLLLLLLLPLLLLLLVYFHGHTTSGLDLMAHDRLLTLVA